MTKRALTLQIIGVTMLALAIAIFWALDPMTAIFMLTRPNITDAELIRQIWHFRLVQPEWIAGPNQLMRWTLVEASVRLIIVFIAWLASVVALTRRHRRGRRSHLTNRSSQPLAGASPHFPV